jgi:hypothetical protein
MPNVARERDRRDDLPVGIGRRAAVAGINDLDPDRGGIHIALALPERRAGVPSPFALGDELIDPSVFVRIAGSFAFEISGKCTVMNSSGPPSVFSICGKVALSDA